MAGYFSFLSCSSLRGVLFECLMKLSSKGWDPQSFNDFRPISLIGCVYKIIAKLLANRLSKVMNHLIDERQTTFVKGRQLLHGVLIANEVVEEAMRSKRPCMVFKVDFEKAYDSVSWQFLFYMMGRMGGLMGTRC